MSQRHDSDADCDRLQDAMAELALGTLAGRERAVAVKHLEHCPACQGQVAATAVVVDQLLQLVAPATAPAGFEMGLFAPLAVEPKASSTRRVLRRVRRTSP